MALVLGTNCGLVTTAPTADPTSTGTTMDFRARALKVTTGGAVTITEMGWYASNATEEANYEVGIYSDSSGAPGTKLFSNTTNAKGTGDGWKVATGLSFALNAGTVYWIALQLDDTATTSQIDIDGTGEHEVDQQATAALQATWTSDIVNTTLLAIYSLHAVAEDRPLDNNLYVY